MTRRPLPPGTTCYLCGEPILVGQAWNRDHHPPRRFFARMVRQAALNLTTLFTHKACNSAYQRDEEYFIAALPVQALESWTADAVLEEFGERVREGGGDRRLYERVRQQFGHVALPDGRIAFDAEFERLYRVVWKLARGSYFTQTGHVLAEQTLRCVTIVLPQDAREVLPNHEWFPYVRDTDSLSHVAAVFDLKMRRERTDTMAIGLMAMLTWDSITALVAFHDLGCPCDRCVPPAAH